MPSLIHRRRHTHRQFVGRLRPCIAGLLSLTLCLVWAAAASAQDEPNTALETGVVEGGADEVEADDGLPRLALAAFTTEIADREPVDDIAFLGSDKRVVYFFTDLRHMKGTTIRHVWTYRGMEMGTVQFEVKGDRWRAWSSKQLLPAWLGTWTVSVLNPDDEVLATESFTYQDAD